MSSTGDDYKGAALILGLMAIPVFVIAMAGWSFAHSGEQAVREWVDPEGRTWHFRVIGIDIAKYRVEYQTPDDAEWRKDDREVLSMEEANERALQLLKELYEG